MNNDEYVERLRRREEDRRTAELRDRIYEKAARGGPYRPRTVDELLDGEPVQERIAWTVERTEKALRRLGLEPFESTPDPASFDPMREITWSPVMGVAWIVDRDAKSVREAWDAWRRACRAWSAWDGRTGRRELEELPPMTLARLRRPWSAARIAQVDAAKSDLINGMVAGTLTATAVDRNGCPVTVPAAHWRYAELRDEEHGRRPSILVGMGGADLRYTDIQIDRATLIRAFPERPLALPPSDAATDARPAPALRTKARPGRKPAVDWSLMRDEAVRLMEHHGAFQDADEEWNSQSKLVEALALFAQNRMGRSVSVTTVRDHVRRWRTEMPGLFPAK